jgi:hypothetical protein
LDAAGIEAVGTGRRIDFGRDRAGVVQTMGRLQGAAPELTACSAPGVTAAQWRDGLVLVFVNNAFTGWRTDDLQVSATGAASAGTACAI